MTYTIHITDPSEEARIAAYEEHKDKIPAGASVCFVCENLDLSTYAEKEPELSSQDVCEMLNWAREKKKR